MFDNLIVEAVAVFAIGGIGLALLSHKNLVMKLAGILFCLLALIQALQSPTLMAALALAGGLYVIFFVIKSMMKKRKKYKKCPDCDHDAHAGQCRNRYCRCA